MYIENEMPLEVRREPILLSWNTYWNVGTGKKSCNLEDVIENGKCLSDYQIIEKTGKILDGISIQYDEPNNLICVIYCHLDAGMKSHNGCESRRWEEIDRIYINSKKEILARKATTDVMNIAKNEGVPSSAIMTTTRHIYRDDYLANGYRITEEYVTWKASNKNTYGYAGRKDMVVIKNEKEKEWYQWDLMKPFHDMFGEVVTISGNQMIALDSIASFILYAKNKDLKKKKQSERLKNLLSIPLPEVTPPCYAEDDFQGLVMRPKKIENGISGNTRAFSVLQRVLCDKPLCVIRFFYSSYYSSNWIEGSRWYIAENYKTFCKNIYGEFQEAVIGDYKYSNYVIPMKQFDTCSMKGTMFEYYEGLMDEIEEDSKLLFLWLVHQYPIIEKMYKTDLLKKILTLAIQGPAKRGMSPFRILKGIFGLEDEVSFLKKKNIYQAIGLNRTQLESLIPIAEEYFIKHSLQQEYLSFRESPIKGFKNVARVILNKSCKTHDIADLDEDTSMFISNHINTVFSIMYEKRANYISSSYFIETNMRILMFLCKMYSLEVVKKAEPFWFQIATRMWMVTYADVLAMTSFLGMERQISPVFKNIEDMKTTHENLTVLYEQKETKIHTEKWKKVKTMLKNFPLLMGFLL